MGCRLAQVEQPLEFLIGVFGQQRHTQGSPGQVAGPIAALGEIFEDDLVGDGNEMPGLGVFGGLGAPAGVEDGLDGLLGERVGVEFAHGAFETDGVTDVHKLLQLFQ